MLWIGMHTPRLRPWQPVEGAAKGGGVRPYSSHYNTSCLKNVKLILVLAAPQGGVL